MVDFGLSKQADTMKTRIGTPYYVSPEVLKGLSYGLESDLWSLGVTVFFMAHGYPPFFGQSETKLFGKILKCDYEISPNVSDEAADFIRRLILVDPKSRMGLKECLEHRWLK